ncbi:hypothetical protein HK100_002828, partial [Physocladia obscura]
MIFRHPPRTGPPSGWTGGVGQRMGICFRIGLVGMGILGGINRDSSIDIRNTNISIRTANFQQSFRMIHSQTSAMSRPQPRQRFFSLGEDFDYEGKWRSRVKQLKRESINQNFAASKTKDLEGSHKVVLLAVTSNACMFCAKLYAASISGSASMFAESLHSLADMLNELLLMIGIRRSLREPDVNHPYGFSSERTAWALVSGVGIFFLGGGVSMYHGIVGLINPHVLGDATVSFGVLGLSLCFEM